MRNSGRIWWWTRTIRGGCHEQGFGVRDFRRADLTSAVAYASSVHVKSGPFFIDNGLTLTATGELAGLGLQDVVIGMTATAKPIATCTNPSGQNQPPGQNPAQVAVSATPQAIPAAEIKKKSRMEIPRTA